MRLREPDTTDRQESVSVKDPQFRGRLIKVVGETSASSSMPYRGIETLVEHTRWSTHTCVLKPRRLIDCFTAHQHRKAISAK